MIAIQRNRALGREVYKPDTHRGFGWACEEIQGNVVAASTGQTACGAACGVVDPANRLAVPPRSS